MIVFGWFGCRGEEGGGRGGAAAAGRTKENGTTTKRNQATMVTKNDGDLVSNFQFVVGCLTAVFPHLIPTVPAKRVIDYKSAGVAWRAPTTN